MTVITNKKQFTTFIILLAAIIIIANMVSRKLFVRFDITDNNMYSLSNSSKSVIKKLDDRIVAKVFFSKNIPGQYANSRRYLQDLLEEYQAYSGGKFHFEFVDPDGNEDAQKQAMSYRIPPVQMQVVENDKLEIKNVYMGLVFLYNNQQEVIPVIQTSDGLEYTLTAAIKKIAATDMKTIGIVKSETGVATSELQKQLSQIYSVRTVSLDKEIPVNITTLLMNGVTDSLSLDELYNLDQYLMRGGKLFVGQGRNVANLQEGMATEISSNIFDFLENYGIQISKDMLIDQQCGQIQVQQNAGFFSFASAVSYPPFLTLHHFNKDNMIVKSLEEVRAFFAHEVIPVGAETNFTSLISTSEKTGSITPGMIPSQNMYGQYSMDQGYNIKPNIKNSQYNNPAMNSFPLKNKPVAALVDGNAGSYFKDNTDFNTRENYIAQASDIEILLISDGEFFNDKRAGGIKENIDFIMNGIDYLSGDQELLEIRSRGITARPLDELNPGSRRFWKWLNVLLPSLLVILLGVYRWKNNQNKRKMLEEVYG